LAELQKYLYFVRHAESEKNVQRIRGGAGLPLTSNGLLDANHVAQWFLADEGADLREFKCFSAPSMQVQETAGIISTTSGAIFEEREELDKIFLGILDGVSENVARKHFPEASRLIEVWRSDGGSLQEVSVPDQESARDFYERVRSFATRCVVNETRDILVVGTRSIGIALVNLFRRGVSNVYDNSSYRRVSFNPASVTKIEINGLHSSVCYTNYTDFLPNRVRVTDD